MGMIWVGYRRESDTARQQLEDEDLLEELLESDDDTTSVDLDKAWHGLHWLLTGSAEPVGTPLSNALFGGEAVGEDLGYGPARLLPPDQVVTVAQALSTVVPDDLRARLDPAEMARAEVYPAIWDEHDIFDDYLADAFERLRRFYAEAAEANEAVIQTVC